MNNPSSYSILQVERAAEDLRRGQSVIVSYQGQKALITADEYRQADNAISDGHHPAVKLLKIAGLLPQAVIEDASLAPEHALIVTEEAISYYPQALAAALEKVSQANVPLPYVGNARIIAFRPRFGHQEHLAILVGVPEKQDAPYVRLHSSCITGDVLGSLRCDCGTQLHKALEMIGTQQHGAILYLSQEGRGISIANKLRAYALQDQGMDTVEANEALGFFADERDFSVAVEMLKQLGLQKIVLMTNNPAKIKALAAQGIEVLRREPLVTETTEHNRKYLTTKAAKMGHDYE